MEKIHDANINDRTAGRATQLWWGKLQGKKMFSGKKGKFHNDKKASSLGR